MSVPSNLVPTSILQLPEDPSPSDLGWMMYVNNGVTYKVQVNSVLDVSGVPTSRAIIAGTGLTGGGTLASNVTISVAPGGIGATQLDATGVTAGVYGDSSNYPIFTVDENGRLTSAGTLALPSTSGFVPTSRQVIAGAGLTGGGTLTGNVTLSAALSNATPQPVGNDDPGTSTEISRADHVHPAIDLADTSQTANELDITRGGTGTALTAPANGGIVYSDGSALQVSSAGSSGQILTSTGAGAPTWSSVNGTVTSVSVVSANGLSGTVANATSTPAITLSTSVTGLLKGNGTAISAAVSGTDYAPATSGSSLLYGNGSGGFSNASIGTGLSFSTGTLTNTAPDQTVVLTAGTNVTITGTYPSFTIAATGGGSGTVTSVAATGGTGISVTGSPITTSGTLNIVNTAPDQVVSLTGAGLTSVTGTYPNFTISSSGGAGGGDVTGPSSSTDNAIARFDGTTGKLIQDSVATLSDMGVLATAQELIGPSASANFTRFPGALSVVSDVASGIQQNESMYIGLMAEAVSSNTTWGSGLYGAGYTNTVGNGRGTGVTGEGHVSATTDTGVAVGVRGYANDTHTGNYNIGLYGDATNGDAGLTYQGNVALFLANGNIVTSAAAAKQWYLGGDLTFNGQGSAKTIGVTNGAVFALGTPASGTLTNCTGYTYANLSGTIPTWNQNTTGSAGSVANALTIGTGLSGTSFNGSAAVTIAIDSTVTTLSGTQTLTNKRVTPRVSTTASSATPTINTDNVDFYGLTAQAVDITSFTTNLSGTPTDGQKLWIYIVGTAARAITWGASFESSTATLPTTTVSTNRLDVGFVWNVATSKWRCVAVA